MEHEEISQTGSRAQVFYWPAEEYGLSAQLGRRRSGHPGQGLGSDSERECGLSGVGAFFVALAYSAGVL